jgi:hypothetical protein
MDEETDACDDQHHHQRKCIEAQADLRREPADIKPTPQGLLINRARWRIEQETGGDREGNDGCKPDRERADHGLHTGGKPPGAEHENR